MGWIEWMDSMAGLNEYILRTARIDKMDGWWIGWVEWDERNGWMRFMRHMGWDGMDGRMR
jgi:beta-lactamase class D